MEHAAAAPGSSLDQQLYVTRVHAKLSAQEAANGAGLRADLLDELEAGATPGDEEAAKIKDAIAALGVGCPAPNISSTMSPNRKSRRNHTSTAGTNSS
jgi:hypothetical protein